MKQLLLKIMLLCLVGTTAVAQTNTWIGGGANTNWNTLANWSLNAVPTAANDVVIPTGFTVNQNVAATVKSINLQGNSTLALTTSFTFTDASTFGPNTVVTWSSGTIDGGGTLTNNGVINLTSAALKVINGDVTLNNAGTFNITSNGDFWIVQGIFNNQATGILDLQADSGNITWSGGNLHVLNNTGIIKKTTSTGEAEIVVEVNNNGGVISVESGTLSFQNTIGKNLTNGTYNVSSGATFDWDGTISLSGVLEGVIDGTLNWNNIVSVSTSATFDFSGSGDFNWTNGQLTGGGTLTHVGNLNLTTPSIKYLMGDTTLNNEGTFNIASNGDLWIVQGVFNNEATGIIDLQVDSANISYSGGTSHILNNFGTIKKTNSTGEAQIIVELNNNNGTISVETGVLSFQGTDVKNLNNGFYNVFSGATFDWDGTVAGSGTMRGTINGSLNWNNILTIAGNATFDFDGSGDFNWTSNNLTGGGTLTNKSILKLTTTGIKYLIGDTTLNNEGTFNIASNGDFWIVQGIVNNKVNGVIDLQADSGDITWSGGISHVLNNAGIIKRTTSTGEAQIVVEVNNNDGIISVESGTLSFQGTIGKNLTDGTYNVFNGATLDWDGTINLLGTLTGTIDGTLNWNNIVNVAATTSATFNFTGSGSFNWTNSNLSGGGTLINQSTINLTTTALKVITGDTTLNNEGTINITSVGDLWVVQGILNNQTSGIIDLQGDNGDISFSGGTSHIFNNFGLLKKSSGASSSTIFTTTTNSGIIDVQTGTLSFNDAYPFNNAVDGIIKGVGTIDLPSPTNYTNNGTFAPGSSPGTLTVLGTYKSTPTSVLDIELNGLTQSTEYDLLAITGTNAIFEGNVNITMGFEANIGNSFTVATVSGLITTKNLVTPIIVDHEGKRYTFDVTYPNDKAVLLTISDKVDIQAPDVLTQDITVQLDASGNASITPLQIDNGSTDNCTLTPNLLFGLDVTTFTCADLGANTVTLTVTDEAGNFADATAIVTVEDTINPTAVTQNITVQLDASGNASITTSQIDNGSSDNCSVATLSLDTTDFTCADLGTNTVNLTVTDQSGNSSSASAIVTVEDTINPTAITQNITVQLDASGNASITTSQIDNGSSDNCSVTTLSLDTTDFTCADLGANTVNLTVTDQSGNTSSASATVTVEDNINPTIICADGFEVESEGGYTLPDYYSDNEVTADDNCTFTVIQTPIPGTIMPHGDYIIQFEVNDTAGNSATCFFELKVIDTTLGVDEQELTESDIIMFPNPTYDYITIKNTSRLELLNVEVYDVLGKLIYRIDLKNMGLTKEISLQNLSSGMYLIEINALNNSITKRVIKQ